MKAFKNKSEDFKLNTSPYRQPVEKASKKEQSKKKVITSVGMGNSVASFLVLGEGASPPQMYRQKKLKPICASERLKNIYFQVTKYICISMQFPFVIYVMALYKTV